MIEREEKRDLKEIVDIRVKKEVEFPKDPEKRFEAIFAAIGNSEAKCLTLLTLSEKPLTAFELHHKFLEESGGVWKTDRKTPAAYCFNTLVPIGLVVEVDILHYESKVWVSGFRLTEAGIKYGQPIAAFLLEKSSNLPYSLLEIFGQTAKCSGKTRSVLNRARILEFLSQKDTVRRETDISKQLKLKASTQICHHLRHLSQLGLIEYSSVNLEEKGFVKYILSENVARDKVEKVSTEPKLSSEIANLLFRLRKADANLLAEKLKKKYPKLSIDSLRVRASKILSGLSRQGVCYPEGPFGKKIRSQTKITSDGEKMVSGIIIPIKRALADDEDLLSSWRKVTWQNYAEEGIAKHKEVSGCANPHSSKEWAYEALNIISQNPGIRRREIESLLPLALGTGRILKILLDQGKIRKEKQGKAVRYYPQ